jgi:hypothetical protein
VKRPTYGKRQYNDQLWLFLVILGGIWSGVLCLVFAVALVLLRMLFPSASVVEYVVESAVDLLSLLLRNMMCALCCGCCAPTNARCFGICCRICCGICWGICCLMFAVALVLRRMLLAVAYVEEYVV